MGPQTRVGPPQYHSESLCCHLLRGCSGTPRHLIQGLALPTAEPGDVSVVMETLPRASGRTSLLGTVSLCVDFAMRCQGSGACWAGWHGVGKADENPHCIPATSSLQQSPRHPWREGLQARPHGPTPKAEALRVVGRPCAPAYDPCLAVAF